MANNSEHVLVSDIHGNYPALQAVVDREGRDKKYIILGDIHGLNAYPKETLDLVREIGNYILSGNHDKAIFQYHEGHVNSDELSEFEYQHTRDALSDEDWQWMQELPHLDVIERGGQRICLTHALPWPDGASGYEPRNSGITKGQATHIAKVVSEDYDKVYHAHTHTQYDLDCGNFGHDVQFVNPGSLGYGSTYSVVDTDSNVVSHKSVEYDTDVESHIQSQLPAGAPPTSEWY